MDHRFILRVDQDIADQERHSGGLEQVPPFESILDRITRSAVTNQR
jgi:hypothetical protein